MGQGSSPCDAVPGTSQSAWRIEYARAVTAPLHQCPGVSFIVLGGSPSRGLSDEYSDLDIVVYWDVEPGWEQLESSPLDIDGGKRVWLSIWKEDGSALESYRAGGLKVDIAHIGIPAWMELIAGVTAGDDASSGSLGSIAGFLDAMPLHGAGDFMSVKSRIPAYPESLARKVVEDNLRFFVKGYLLHQALERGELLALQDGVASSLKKMLAVLAALNRVWFSSDEPRWLRFWLERMPLKPVHFLDRMEQVLSGSGPRSLEILEDLVEETISLVEENMPGLDTATRRRRRIALGVSPCPGPPTGGPAGLG